MLVRDLMTTGVLSVSPTVPVSFIVELLAERALPGVPVIDTGDVLVGMVTESDLLRRLALSDEPQHGWLRGLFDNHDHAADRYARAHGATERDVMTTRLWTVDEDTSAEHAARLLEAHKVRRLPVLRDEQLVGMVSRADLLRALLPSTTGGRSRAAARSDAVVKSRPGRPKQVRRASPVSLLNSFINRVIAEEGAPKSAPPAKAAMSRAAQRPEESLCRGVRRSPMPKR